MRRGRPLRPGSAQHAPASTGSALPGRALPDPLKLAALELLSGNFTVGFGIHSCYIGTELCGPRWEGSHGRLEGVGAAGQGVGMRRRSTLEEAQPRALQASVASSAKWKPQLLCQHQRKAWRSQETVWCFPSVR